MQDIYETFCIDFYNVLQQISRSPKNWRTRCLFDLLHSHPMKILNPLIFCAWLIFAVTLSSCSDASYDRIPEKVEGYPGVTLFIFHTSWCTYCITELPLLKKIHAEYSPCGLHMIGVNEDDNEKTMEAFVKAKEIPYKVVYWDFALMKKFGHPRSIPTHFLVDSTGNILLRQIGPLNEKDLLSKIENALDITNCRP